MMNSNVKLKMKHEVSRIRSVCRLIAGILEDVSGFISPGQTTSDIELFCIEKLDRLGISPAVDETGGFPGAICVSVNHVAAHGIPGSLVLHEKDIVTVDIAGSRDGWHGDSAWTYLVGSGTPRTRRLLKCAWTATMQGIEAARAGGRLGDIGDAIGSAVGKYGCSVITNCVGHGIGRALHEDPSVLPLGTPDTDLPIVPGMVFTIEPVVTLGKPDIVQKIHGHEIHTSDQSLCAQFEHTVAVFSDHTELLTQKNWNLTNYLDFPPFF